MSPPGTFFFTHQPEDASLNEGVEHKLYCSVAPADTPDLTYTWYRSDTFNSMESVDEVRRRQTKHILYEIEILFLFFVVGQGIAQRDGPVEDLARPQGKVAILGFTDRTKQTWKTVNRRIHPQEPQVLPQINVYLENVAGSADTPDRGRSVHSLLPQCCKDGYRVLPLHG